MIDNDELIDELNKQRDILQKDLKESEQMLEDLKNDDEYYSVPDPDHPYERCNHNLDSDRVTIQRSMLATKRAIQEIDNELEKLKTLYAEPTG